MEERIGPCKVLCQFGGVPLELAAAGNVGVWSPFPESGIGQFCRWSRSSWSFGFLEERYYILCKVLRQHLFGDCQPIQLGCEEQIREGTEGSIKTTWKACFAFTPTYLTVRTIFFSYASSSAPHPRQSVIRWVVVSNYRSLELTSWLAFFYKLSTTTQLSILPTTVAALIIGKRPEGTQYISRSSGNHMTKLEWLYERGRLNKSVFVIWHD